MNFNNPEEITKYVNLATNVLMGVDDVVRAFKDKPRRPSFQQFMDERMGVKKTDPLKQYLRQFGYDDDLFDDTKEKEEDKTPEEKTAESMIGEAVQDTSVPVTRLQTIPYDEGGKPYKVGDVVGEAVQETSAPVTRLQAVPYSEGGQRYEVGMDIQRENQIDSPESYRRRGFEPTLDERGNIIGLLGPEGSKFKVTRAGEIIPVGPF